MKRNTEDKIRWAIEQQKEYYETIIHNLNTPALVINTDHEVVIWNKSCELLTNCKAEDMIGTKNHWQGFYKEERALLADIVLDDSQYDAPDLYLTVDQHSFVEGGQRAYNWCDMPNIDSKLYLEINACPIRDKEGNVMAVIELLMDMTQQKIAEDMLSETVTDLRKSNENLERFAYVASHDLKEPLRAITSYTQLLKKYCSDKLNDDEFEFIEYILSGSKRMNSLIDDLLQYSRVGARDIKLVKINANELFDYAVTNLAVSIGETNTVVTKDELPEIFCDKVLFRQLFQNLIGNAVKYRDQDKENAVHVSCECKDEEVVFCFEDNGIGIDQKYYDKIFVIFKRLHSHDQYTGTGIGLAVCQNIVEQHGGKIWLQSKLGEGSRFYFSLPIKKSILD